jgi:hypothetical protein
MKYLANGKKENDKDGAMVDETSVDELAEGIGDMRAGQSQSILFVMSNSHLSFFGRPDYTLS